MLKKWLTGDAKPTVVCSIISAVSLVLSLLGWTRGFLPFDIAWVAIALCGIPIVFGAAKALILERDIKADLLVSLALISSVIIGEYFAAGEVALIMQIGSLLEEYTSAKARHGIEKLISLTPQTANVKKGGAVVTVPANTVAVGDVLVVRAGETIPVDGVITAGATSIDQSAMTGESIPVDKRPGDRVSSGTLNRFGAFEMIAEKLSGDSSLQRMIRLAREADANKAPIVGLADKWAAWMVVAAVVIAIMTWIITHEVIRAVTVLVVFCPCAFILATPTAIMAGIGNAAKFGILIRSGDALERISKVNVAAFDKTGTLTLGKPIVTAVVSLTDEYSEGDMLAYAATVEEKSEHPLGQAILAHYTALGGRTRDALDFQMIAGMGVSANVDGHAVSAGKPEHLSSRGTSITDRAFALAKEHFDIGATVIFVAVDGSLAGFIALADSLRPDSAETIRKLKSAGVSPLLLTGDNEASAKEIAAKVGIENFRSGLLPEDKMLAIEEYGKNGDRVCMIGDGVNDALALGTAFAGIAMGTTGSDIAVESADAVLAGDEIKRLPYLFRMTKKVMRKVSVNIILSLVINIAAVTLSVLGVLDPVTGALMHNCGSVLVVVNAALLLREKDDAE